jgi:7-alpha-hydroxysteroid dehydrogenase
VEQVISLYDVDHTLLAGVPNSAFTEALAFVTSMPGIEEGMVAKTPMARLGEPEDIALAALYLASPASAWVTGQILAVDGGAPTSVWPFPIPSGL